MLVTSFLVSMIFLQWMQLRYMRTKYQRRCEVLVQEARRDPLTGLANRRLFDEWSHKACSLARRQDDTLCLAMIDIDHFKIINDTFGHSAGDEVLKAVAERLKADLREHDISARLGGEEFVIAMPNITLTSAIEVAERIRESFVSLNISFNEQHIPFTASIGVTALTTEELTCSEGFQYALLRADKALYRAKYAGRNRTVAIDHEAL